MVKTFCYKKIEELLLSYFLVEEDGRDEGRGTRDEGREEEDEEEKEKKRNYFLKKVFFV